jgi:glycosyltransferase involved in cell wall biosynthesis
MQINPVHYIRNLKGMFQVSRKMREVAQVFEPTHIYIPNYIQFLYALPGIMLLKKPVLFRIGDPPETTALHRLLWSQVIAPKVTAFVTNSEFTRQRLLQAVGKTCNSRVIQNCITRQNSIAEIPLNKPNPVVIIYLGQFNASKGVHVAIDAAIEVCRLRQNVVFKFIGLTEPLNVFSIEMIKKVKEANLESRINLMRFQDEIQSLLACSSLHLCPSLQEESSANVVIEAKQAGVPSVVFRKGGLPELIRHTIDGFVTKTHDVKGLVEGILFFLDQPERIRQAGAAARESSLRHTPSQIGPLWKAVVQESRAVQKRNPLKS